MCHYVRMDKANSGLFLVILIQIDLAVAHLKFWLCLGCLIE